MLVYLRAEKACCESIPWARQIRSFEAAWRYCDEPEWLLWGLEHGDYYVDREGVRTIRQWACWCVRQIWPLVSDERSRRAVECAERHTRGEATDEQLEAAWAEAGPLGGQAWPTASAAWAAQAAGESAGPAPWKVARAVAEALTWLDKARAPVPLCVSWPILRKQMADKLREVLGPDGIAPVFARVKARYGVDRKRRNVGHEEQFQQLR